MNKSCSFKRVDMKKEVRKNLYFRRNFIGIGFIYHHNSTPKICEEKIYVFEFKFLNHDPTNPT